MKYEGNLIITADNIGICETLTSVGGCLYISAEGVSLPALTASARPVPDALSTT